MLGQKEKTAHLFLGRFSSHFIPCLRLPMDRFWAKKNAPTLHGSQASLKCTKPLHTTPSSRVAKWSFLKMERPQNHPSDLLKYYCNKENQWSRDTPIVKNIRISPSPRSKLAVLLTRAALASPYPHGRWILPGLMCEEWWLARLFYQKAYKLRVHHLKEGITSNFRRKDLQMLVWGCTNHPAVWPKFDSQAISDLATWLSQASSVSY